jgi:hypothetical protein
MSARVSLHNLIPWLPTMLCLFILLTVYFLPKIRQPLDEDIRDLTAMEEGRSLESFGAQVGPESIRSEASSRHRPQSREENDDWRVQATFHTMGGIDRPWSPNSGVQSIHGSDITLSDITRNSGIRRLDVGQIVSPSRPGYSISSLPQTAADIGHPSARFAATRPGNSTEGCRRTEFSESMHVESASSSSAESETPLMG